MGAYNTTYADCTAGTTTVCGANGKKRDVMERLAVNVTTAATSSVSIIDGSGAGVVTIVVVPSNTPVGVYSVELGARSVVGGWSILCGAGANAVAVGNFS